MTAAEFNRRYPVGTPVVAYPGARPDRPGYNPARRLETVTRTPAWTLGHGTGAVAVVSVEGYAGAIALSHVDSVAADAAAPGGEGR